MLKAYGIIGILAVALGAATVCSAEAPGTQCTTPGEYQRFDVTLSDAVGDGLDVRLHLGRQSGRFQQLWAQLPWPESKAVYMHDRGLRVTDQGGLTGEVELRYSRPGDSREYLARYDLNFSPADGKLTGEYSGTISRIGPFLIESEELLIDPQTDARWFLHGETFTDDVTGRIMPRLRDEGEVTARIRTREVVIRAAASRFNRSSITMRFDDGKLVSSHIEPSTDQKFWAGEIRRAEATLTDDALSGTLVVDVRKLHKKYGPTPGVYTMRFKAGLQANSLDGRITSELKGKSVRNSGMKGTLEPTAEVNRLGDSRIFELKLHHGLARGRDVRVELPRVRGKWLQSIARGPLPTLCPVDASKLKLTRGESGDAPDALSGPLTVTFLPGSGFVSGEPLKVTYHLDAEIRDREIAGRFRTKFGHAVEVSGKAVAAVRDGDQLRRLYSIDPNRDWPSHIGPNDNYSAMPTGHRYVRNLRDARLLWKSEVTPPARLQTTRYGEGNIARVLLRGGPAGGGCSPIVYDGKVYLFYVKPRGEKADPAVLAKFRRRNTRTWAALWSQRVDDVVLCLDAATGQTLWKVRLPDAGAYLHHPLLAGSTKRGAYTTSLAAGGGKVFVHGSSKQTLCFEADTGELLWTNPLGNGELKQVIDGALAVAHGNDLVGIDTETGETRFRIRDVASRFAVPTRWDDDGKTWIVSASEGGKMACVEANTGDVRWTAEDVGNNAYSLVRFGDVVVGSERIDERSRMVAWELSADGPRRLWHLKGERYQANQQSPTGRGDVMYFRTLEPAPEHLLAMDVQSGEILSRTRFPKPPNPGSGTPEYTNGHVLVQLDSTHSSFRGAWFSADGRDVQALGKAWSGRHPSTTSYTPVMMTNPLADGHLFIRGKWGIYCYDLTAPEAGRDDN
jgi:outer membrane protein assembly factor BamB